MAKEEYRNLNKNYTNIYNTINNKRKKFGDFHKCIFHLHTPTSYDYHYFEEHKDNTQYFNSLTIEDLYELCLKYNVFPTELNLENIPDDSLYSNKKELLIYVLLAWKIISENIKLVIVTDHNTISGYRKLKKAIEYIHNLKSYLVYPTVLLGIEISCADKNHVVCIFNNDKVLEDKINGWIKEFIFNEKEGTYKTSIQVIQEVYKYGGIAYIAHIDTSDIFHEKYLNGVFKKTLFSLDGLNVIGLSNIDKIEYIENCLKNYTNKEFCYIIDEDSHSIDTIGTKAFWIKGSKCDFSMIVNAIHDFNISIEYKYPSVSTKYIKGMIITNCQDGFLKGINDDKFVVDFSDSLNCIIGGRGSGKSTILNILDFVLGLNGKSNEVLNMICNHEEIYILCSYNSEDYLVIFNAPQKLYDNDDIVKYLIDISKRTRGSSYYYDNYKEHVTSFVMKNCLNIYHLKIIDGILKYNSLQLSDKRKFLEQFFKNSYSVNELVNTASLSDVTPFIHKILFSNVSLVNAKKIKMVKSLNGLEKLIKDLNSILIKRKEEIKRQLEIFNTIPNNTLRISYIQTSNKFYDSLDFSSLFINFSPKKYYNNYNITKGDIISYLDYITKKKGFINVIYYFITENYVALQSICDIQGFTTEMTTKLVEMDITSINSSNYKIFFSMLREDIFTKYNIEDISNWLIMCVTEAETFEFEFDVNSNEKSVKAKPCFKKVNQLSLGQKVVAMLTFIISYGEQANDYTPLLIDQPEDNLDSQYIYQNLVKELRNIKTKRQVIIATHNATLVTNAKAEQVIVMDSDNVNGWIVTTGYPNELNIKKYIINYLEGGQDSFKHKCFIYSDVINNKKDK